MQRAQLLALRLTAQMQAQRAITVHSDNQTISVRGPYFIDSAIENETDILDNDWLDSARLIYVQYRYSRSTDGKPQAYLDLLQKFRIMGV